MQNTGSYKGTEFNNGTLITDNTYKIIDSYKTGQTHIWKQTLISPDLFLLDRTDFYKRIDSYKIEQTLMRKHL